MCTRADKLNCLEFWVKIAKMTSKVKVNELHFQYQSRVSHDICLVKIWWSRLKFVTSYCGDVKVYGQTDGQTDGQMQATTIHLRPERERVKTNTRLMIRKCLPYMDASHLLYIKGITPVWIPVPVLHLWLRTGSVRLDQPAVHHTCLSGAHRSHSLYALEHWASIHYEDAVLSV